jgi:hypothetical protein
MLLDETLTIAFTAMLYAFEHPMSRATEYTDELSNELTV